MTLEEERKIRYVMTLNRDLETKLNENYWRQMDMVMLMLLNAQEREEVQWKSLFERADARFKYLGARKPRGALLSIIEAVWEG